MKKIQVESCRECDHCESHDDFISGYCFHPKMVNSGIGFMNGVTVPMDGTIDPDCPLPDDDSDTIEKLHKLMVSGEQRGIDKANQEWIDKINNEIKYLDTTLKGAKGLNENITLIYESQLALAKRLLTRKEKEK